ncbi:MAG: prepilin cleavage protein [Legionella sp.]|nr:prepilin cleavage protein [Legionella sp.]
MNNPKRSWKSQGGFGLTEVMMSLFLACILMTVLTQLYLNNKTQYIHTRKSLDEQFDLQWVQDLLVDSIRRAGFTPCLGLDALHAIDKRVNPVSITGVKIDNERQEIKVNRMSEHFSLVQKFLGSRKILLEKAVVNDTKRPLLIADCYHAEVQTIQRIETVDKGSLVILSQPLQFSYSRAAYAGEWLEERWFIQTNPKGRGALYYQLGQTEELTPLIHSLHTKSQHIFGKSLLEITLGLDNAKTKKITVAVRGS